jgi:hypothetical protein
MNSMGELFTCSATSSRNGCGLGLASFDHWYATFAEAASRSRPGPTTRSGSDAAVRFKNLKLLHSIASQVMDHVGWRDGTI